MNTKEHSNRKLAYLVSRYPAISHTFILNEVLSLKALGFDIQVASINDPDRTLENLTQAEREEANQTYYVKSAGLVGAAGAHLSTFFTNPITYLRGLMFAIKLSGADLKKMFYCFCYFIEAVMIGQWMRSNHHSRLHVHFATPASTVGLIAKQIFSIQLSITIHGPDEFYDAPGYQLAEKIHGADFICCIGVYARSQLMKLSPPSEWKKFEVSPLGVDLTTFQPRPLKNSSAPFEIICVGRLVPAKGQHILIEAFAKLIRNGYSARLRLVGDGPDRESLERMVIENGLSDNVLFEGAVNQDRIRSLYQEADAFVLASFAEGIPVVLMEAMAMEIPCITTFITGIPELIRDGKDGLLVSPSDVDGLSQAIARLIEDPQLRQRLGTAGRRRVQERYNINKNI